jgi:PDZ domain
MRTFVVLLFILSGNGLCLAAGSEPIVSVQATPKEQLVTPLQKSAVVRVNSTNQSYDFFRPWSKKAPINRRGLGVFVDGGKILVAAQLVDDSTYIELERPDGGEKSRAQVEVIDREANVATLTPADPKFIGNFQPLEVDTTVKTGDRLALLQLEANGTPVSTQALVTSVDVGRYVLEDTAFLLFRLSCPLQYRENSFTLPLLKENKLAGFLMRYDPRSQTVDAIPGVVIAHFLRESARLPYQGFPRVGISYSSTHDPQLRRFSGLKESDGGVYVNQVEYNGPAAKAGIQSGDILVAIGDNSVDADGNYTDPLYGKVAISNLTTVGAYCGDRVPMTVIRHGERRRLEVPLFRVAPEDYVVPPYIDGHAPHYFVLGGLVFQELSRSYLREWGANWAKEAPQRLVYFDRFQSDLFRQPRKLVILSQVLPTQDTVGYEQLNYLVVTKLNGVGVQSLDDFARAAQKPANGFHRIEFGEDPHEIYLDAQQVIADAPNLQTVYSLPDLQRL